MVPEEEEEEEEESEDEPVGLFAIRRKLVSERRANPEEIFSVLVWPWDRPGHRQEAAVRPVGERRDRNPELDEAPLPKLPAEAGPSKRVYLKQSPRPDTGVVRVQGNARRHTSARSLSGVPRTNGRTASRNSEGPTTTAGG